MKHTTTELLVNTRSKRGKQSLKEIQRSCQELGLTIDTVNTVKGNDDLHDTLKQIVDRSPRALIVGSGDGTVSEVVDYLAGSPIILGVVPLGTTNNFARSLGLPMDINDSLKVIKHGHTTAVDVGQIGDEYFSNIAGIGLSALIARKVTNTRKKRFGRLAYPLTGISLLFRHKPFFVTITDKDRELQLHMETHQLIIANGKYHAGKEIASDASLKRHELILFQLGGKSKLSFVWHMIDFYIGRRKSVRHSSYLIGRNVAIHTSTPQSVELDGEVKLTTPMTASVRKQAVKVFCPR